MIRRLRRHDEGFSLIELLVAMSLFAVVITIVGSVIISSLTAERSVRDVTGSTTGGQLVANVVEQTVRNSTAIRVEPSGDDASVFVAVRTTAGGAPRCHAFFFDAEENGIFERTSAFPIDEPNSGEVGDEWTLISDGIVPIPVEDAPDRPVFELAGTRGLAINYTVDGASGPASLFSTAVTGRAPESNASPSCF